MSFYAIARRGDAVAVPVTDAFKWRTWYGTVVDERCVLRRRGRGGWISDEPCTVAGVTAPLVNLLQDPAPLLSSGAGAEEELPGLGHKFELLFGMNDDRDPLNPTNYVISVTTSATVIGVARRKLPPGIKIAALDNQINLKYFFVAPRTCAAGSPRITLLIDANGDNVFNQQPMGPDFAIHGHVNAAAGGGCVPGRWAIEDLTDELTRWEVTPGTAIPSVIGYVPWDVMENAVMAIPTHQVLTGSLVDDSTFTPTGVGKAYYDQVTIENRTLENDHDAVRNNRPGSGQ